MSTSTVTITLQLEDDSERELECSYYYNPPEPDVGAGEDFGVEEVCWEDAPSEPVPEDVWPGRQQEIEDLAMEELRRLAEDY